MATKNISLVIAGGANDGHRQIHVNPGDTINQVLEAQNLQGYQLSLGQGKPFLAGTDNLYDAVETGGKVYATTVAQQGESLFI